MICIGVGLTQEEAQAPQGGAEGQAGDQLQHPPDQAQALQQVSNIRTRCLFIRGI